MGPKCTGNYHNAPKEEPETGKLVAIGIKYLKRRQFLVELFLSLPLLQQIENGRAQGYQNSPHRKLGKTNMDNEPDAAKCGW